MPELAEVEFYRQRWQAGLGQSVVELHLNEGKRLFRKLDPALLRRSLVQQPFLASFAHGKQLLFQFGTQAWLGLHLGMTGQLRVEANGFASTAHDHLILVLQNQSMVFSDPRLFGLVQFHAGPQAPSWWSQLTPEILSPHYTLERMEEFLARRRNSPLKGVLLLQEGFPGIGNWMADEILWQSRLLPAMPAGSLTPVARRRLYHTLQQICRQALATIGRDFSNPPDTWLFGYRWESGQRCPRDGTLLSRDTIGGRTTCWCSKCQGAR